MSFGTASVDVELDAKRAVSQLQSLLSTIASSNATVTLAVNVSNVAPAVEGAIDAADSEVTVVGDAQDVTGSINGAVDAADAAVEVTGDATEVTGSIDGAVDAADAHVVVTGDAAEVTGSIDGAVQAADTSVTITADDDGSVDSLTNSLNNLNLGTIAATNSGLRFRTVFKTLSVAGVATGLFQAAQAASDLAESTSKATVVFGAGIDEIQAFASTSATALGLSEQAALEATGTFGNLFVAMGATKDQATDLAPEVVTLASDLASFNNLGVDETLEKLRSGLVGEIEPLRSLGISFNAAQVEAKAMELGLADANGAVSEGAKLQARWALILEQSTTAQGDFARTSDGLANQQRILSAEFQNSVTALGQALLPALLEGVGVARDQLIPAFQEFGESVLPALADIFVSLLPVAGGFTNLLVAMAPALTAVASAISSVPPELITLIGLLVAFRKIGGSDLVSGLVSGFKNLANPATGPGGFTTSLKGSIGSMVAANAASVGLSLGLGVVALAFEENAREAAEFARQVATIKGAIDASFEPGISTVDGFTKVFENLVDQGGTAASLLAGMGVTAEEFGAAVSSSSGSTQDLTEALGFTSEELGILNAFVGEFNEQLNQATRQQVEAIRASGELSESFVDQAVKAATTKEQFGDNVVATVDYVEVLGTLTDEQARLAAQIGVTVDETGALVEATGPAADAAERLQLTLDGVTTAGGDTNTELVRLAIAASDARIAEEDLQAVADTLGVSMEDLQGFIGTVVDITNELTSATLSTLPSIQDLAGEFDQFTIEGFRDSLAEALEAAQNFNTNLATISEEGGPRVAAAAAQLGPGYAQVIAEGIRDGRGDVIDQIELLLAGLEGTTADTTEIVNTQLGPNLAAAIAGAGDLATAAFGDAFHPEVPATVATHGTIASIEQEDANMTAAGQGLGTSGTDGFRDGISDMSIEGAGEADLTVDEIKARNNAAILAGALFGGSTTSGFSGGIAPMPGIGISASNATITGVKNKGPSATVAGSIFGIGFTGGTRTGAAGMPGAASSAAQSAIDKVIAKQSGASNAGFGLGAALGQGMQSGINSVAAAVAAGAAALVEAAIAAARSKARTGSPSKLFAELGDDMGMGVVVGLEGTTRDVADASADLVTAAASVAANEAAFVRQARALNTSIDLAGGSSTAAGATSTNITIAAGAVQVRFTGSAVPTTDEARAVGDEIGNAVADTLERRSLRVAARTA